MALTTTVVPFQLSPTETIDNSKLNQLGNPTVSVTGSVANADLASGAVTAAKSAPDAFWYAAATGTDTYVATLSPAMTSLADGLRVRIKFQNANTSTAPTLNANSLGAKVIYYRLGPTLSGVVRPGSIGANSVLSLTYNSSLNSSAGGWEMEQERLIDGSIIGATRGLNIANNSAAPDSKIDISATEVIVRASDQTGYTLASLSTTVDFAASGANGLDTGAEASSTWYYVWAIYNYTSATAAGLLSASSASPTLPAGYTAKALIGVIRNDGSSNIVRFQQYDRRIWCVSTNVFTGKNTSVNNTWEILAGADLTAFRAAVPPIACCCSGLMGSSNTAEGANMALGAVNADGTLASSVVGVKLIEQDATSSTLDSFAAAANFTDLPVRGGTSAYNIQWKTRLNSLDSRLDITGYTF